MVVAADAGTRGSEAVADVEGVNDVVPDEAFLFPKNDPEGLAKKIMEVSVNKELEDHLTTKGLEHVKVFDMDNMVENYLNKYICF